MQTVKISFLGTGDAFSAGGRNQSAYLIESPVGSPEGALLLDCGATVLASINRQNMSAESIDTIFISHLHGDHISGLPFLFLHYLYIQPRSQPLRIIGPPGVERRVRMLFEATYADTAAEPLSYALEFTEALPQKELRIDGIRFLPFAVPHSKNSISLGCEIEIGGRKIVYTGDSGWTEDLSKHTQNADLFICECSYFETRVATHMDYPMIAENLARFGAKRTILTHLGEEVLLRRQDVHIEMAYDGLTVLLPCD
jgi:ribonuclease BN (tRNA processing enzyme)